MAKILKKSLSLAIALVMLTAALFVSASALEPTTAVVSVDAEATAEVQLNGKLIDFPSGVPAYYDKAAGRVFVPFRDLFETLGATVEYDDATRVVTAVRGDTTVTFSRDAAAISVTAADKTETIQSDVAPITIDGRVLVPIRFMSNALGAKVGWDSAERTAIIVDAYSLIAADDTTYTVLDKLLTLQAAPAAGNQALSLKLDANIASEEESMSLPISVTADGVASQTAVDAKITVKADLTPIMGQSVPGLSAKYDIEADVLFNAETGTFGILSELLNQTLGLAAGTWGTLDYNALIADYTALLAESGVDIGDLTSAAAGLTDGRAVIDYITAMIIDSQDYSYVDDFAAIEEALDIVKAVYGDDAFKKDGNKYVSTLLIPDGLGSIAVTVNTDSAGKGVSLDLDISITDDTGVLTLTMLSDASKFTLKLDADIEGTQITADMTMTVAPTAKQPRTDIPAGAPTSDLLGLIKGLQ